MAEIELGRFTPQHGKEFPYIYAYDDRETVTVQALKLMPRFVGRDVSARETKLLYVRAPLCDEATIQAMREILSSPA